MTAPRTRLWVARHAPAIDGLICYGRTDVAVRVAPQDAAQTLLESYRGEKPRRVWTSPVSRCRLVAEHVAKTLGVPLAIEDALCEIDFGAWEGRLWKSIQTDDRAAYEAWMANWEHLPPPSGESPRDIEARVRAWVSAVTKDDVAWLIAHSGVVRALAVIVEGATWPDAMRRQVAHLTWNSFDVP
ncbi:MAG: histidine phosphatase family protein [Polyangiaceae bacterium]